MSAREAFDLTHWACRRNFTRAFKYNWRRAWWWKLVISDTYNRVCSNAKDMN